MKRIAVLTWIKLVLVLAAAMLLATVMDPYLHLNSPLAAQAVNAVLPVTFAVLIWGLSGRAWFALVAEAGLLALLGYADSTKVFYLNTNLVYADFMVIGGMLQDPQLVLGFVHLTAMTVVVAVLSLAAVVAAWWFTRHGPRASWWFRTGCVVASVLACAVIWNVSAPYGIPTLHWQAFAQGTRARQVGVAGNVMLGLMTTHAMKPRPDMHAEQAFWNEPLVREAERKIATAGNGRRPDIVIVQSESLFAPSSLRGFADKPLLKHIVGGTPPLAGQLEVPVFGGRTLQTEFEVLAGAPIAFYPGSMFAYYELVNHRIDALPRVLDGLGYQTIAMHPNDRGFWHRGTAMPDLGFGTFQDIGSFLLPRDLSDRGKVSDAALTRTVLAELDAATGPTFVFAVTMENHGPWGAFAPKDDSELQLPAGLSGKARAHLADYVVHALAADRSFAFLTDALERRGRPTVVLVYGDHLPALPLVYAQLGFKDGKPPETHHPPYRVWANFSLPPAPAMTSAYLLQGWLLHAAGLPLRGHVLANLLAGMVAHDPGASASDRQRVLAEYANIAAANVSATAQSVSSARTFFFDRKHALDVLLKQRPRSGGDTDTLVRDNDLYLDVSKDMPVEETFALRSRVASLTLRPYARRVMNADCVSGGAAMNNSARITVTGDGRVLYRAVVTPRTVRLATLDTRGVRQLRVRADDANGVGACSGVYVRVAQLLCYSARCDRPGPDRPVGSASPAPSRILAADPIQGDLAALDRLRLDSMARPPQQLDRLDSRMANLRWLLGRKLGQKKGLAPFAIQADAQLFMHPAEDHGAWMEFNVSGVDQLELTPRINTLDATCKAMNDQGREAGVVGLTISLDGKPVRPRWLIDRTYHRNISVPMNGAHDLRVEVDKGNEVSACDWFSMGVDAIRLGKPALTPDAAGASTSAAIQP